MATRTLTNVAWRASLDQVLSPSIPEAGLDWRAILAEENIEEIWASLSTVAQTTIHDHAEQEYITQEIFLHLIVTNRFRLYLEEDYSNEEIRRDLLSLLER